MTATNEPAVGEVTAPPEIVEETAADQATLDSDLLALPPDASFNEYVTAWVKRVRRGESGVLPVIGGLIVIVIIFQIENSRFLTDLNLVNLLQQSAEFIVLGMAEIFVLLLGEILAYPPINLGWEFAIPAGLATSATIGFAQGQLISRLRLPPFVVTLGGLLFWEGFLIWVINNQSPSNGGSIRIDSATIYDIVNGNLSLTAGWIVLAVGLVLFAVASVTRDRRRRAGGLVAPPLILTLAKVAAVSVAGIVLVWICNANRAAFVGATVRGVPWVVPIIIALVVAWTFLLTRSRFGRYVYAIGGNREAARRAGINVHRVRVLAYTLAGLTAAAAIIILDSRTGGVTTDIDGGQTVLYGVAAAVIGGTSLLGGRGKMVHALLGGLVIATIYNGMGLLSLSTDFQYMITALVLLAAVTVDALSRRGAR